MKVILIAAGNQTRWNNYQGVNKHMVMVEGEVLLERTIRQLKELGIDKSDILVVSRDYKTSATDVYPVLNYEQNADADKFLSSKQYWDEKERTIIVYGDVYFTDEAIKSIIEYERDDWRLFCRPKASQVTGTKWGECFAISMYPKHHRKMLAKLDYIAELHRTGYLKRCGGWELVRAMMNKSRQEIKGPHVIKSDLYYVIDDLTDDIDFPDDYDRLIEAIERSKVKLSVTIMAHPRRKDYVDELQEELPEAHVEWDRGVSLWDTARRSWLSYDKEATHHMVLQDDAVFSKDLIKSLEKAIKHAPNEIITPCTIAYKLTRNDQIRYQRQLNSKIGWFKSQSTLSAVAIIVPTNLIDEMIDFCDKLTTPHDDRRILTFAKSKRMFIHNTVPSLVDHRPPSENPSLIENHDLEKRGTRQAFIFIGEENSGIDINWKQ